jgi:selenocysteine lyase/cysteine desulfurase
MTISEILSNEELRHHEFPVTRDRVFLGHAGVSPMPRRVSEAVAQYATQCSLGDQETLAPYFNIQETRALAAKFLHAETEEIAFVGPTSLALSYAAAGVHLRRGDNILIYFDDYPSNVYPWMALAQRGIQVRLINTRELGRIRTVDVMGQVDEQTRLVALATNHFITGFRLELDAIGKYLRDRNILFCVDAIQSLGAFPTTVENIDILAADAHKWLLGPNAAGILYVRKNLIQGMRPPVYGWHNVDCPNFVAQEQIEFKQDARRFEVGTQNLLGLVGLRAAMELAMELGVDNIAAELLRKRAWLVPALIEKGCVVLNASPKPENASAIVSFHRPGQDMAALQKKLEEARISVALRTDRAGINYIRLSPHYYNTDAELQRVIELV